MPTLDATLLPAPPSEYGAESESEFEYSSRSLDQVGVEAVLGAMVAARRASQVSALELAPDDEASAPGPEAASAPARRPAHSEVFLKAR